MTPLQLLQQAVENVKEKPHGASPPIYKLEHERSLRVAWQAYAEALRWYFQGDTEDCDLSDYGDVLDSAYKQLKEKS